MKGVRKLACLSIGFCAAVFAAHYLIAASDLTEAAILCLIAAAASFLTKGGIRKRLLLVTIAAAVGLFYYKITVDIVLSPTEALDGETLTVTATVIDNPEYRENCVLLRVRLRESSLPQSETLIVSYDKTALDFKAGDTIRAELCFSSARERFGEYSDLNISKGLTAVTRLNGEAELISASENGIEFFPKRLALSLRATINDVFPDDTEAFMRALLTGDRSSLYEDTELDTAMAVSGITHVVAVSGMHVAFLVGLLQLILGHNKRLSLLCILTVWVFVLMVGAPPSSVRAGVMQTMLLSAPLFRRESDSLTSLSFALAVILIGNPFACGSVGLQLSFGAMAGIMLFSKPLYNRLKKRYLKLGRVGDYIIATFASSISVSVFSIPLIAVHFGYVSIYSALTNILCLWTVSLLFSGGLLLCALSLISKAAAGFLAELISYGVCYIAVVVKTVANLPYAALYVESIAVIVWLLAVYAAFGVCIFRKGKGLKLASVFTLLSLVLLIVGTVAVDRSDGGTVAALNVGNGQCIVFTAKENTVVVDCGHSGTSTNAGAELAQYLGARGRTNIDCLVFTHLDDDHINGFRKLLCLIDDDKLMLPETAKYGEKAYVYREIRELANENGVEIQYINGECAIDFEAISLTFYKTYRLSGNSNDRGLLLSVGINGHDTLITGDAGAKTERKLACDYDLSNTEVLIVGHHGSSYSCTTELIAATEPKTAIISVGYNRYGHPSYRVLTLLETAGCDVHRTDADGRVVIKLS